MTKSDRTTMKKIGIWVDHKEAIIVLVENAETSIEHVESNTESHFRPTGGWKSSGTNVAQSVSKEQTADERKKHQLHDFYQMIIKKADKGEKIFIFGPGEAKCELKKEIEKIKGQHGRIAAVETSDRLTENQIVAKVKLFFSTLQDQPG